METNTKPRGALLPRYDKEKYKNNPELEKFDKSKPYISSYHADPVHHLNGKAKFPGGDPIVCADLGQEYGLQVLKQEHGKVNLTQFSSIKKIEAALLNANRATWQLQQRATDKTLVDPRWIGRELIERFRDMQKSGQEVDAVAVGSTTHAMTFKLRIKQGKDGTDTFVIAFHDSNFTDTEVRCEVKNLNDLEHHSLRDYMQSSDTMTAADIYDFYFKDEVCLMFSYSTALAALEALAGAPVQETHGGKLKNANLLPLTPSLFHHLADTHAIEDEIVQKLMNFDAQDLTNFLKKPVGLNNTSCLYSIVLLNYPKANKVLAELLKKLPIESRVALLEEKDENGTPWVLKTMRAGKIDTIIEWTKLLQWVLELENEDRIIFLTTKDKLGTSWLLDIMQRGTYTAIKLLWSRILPLMPENKRARLLDLGMKEGISCLWTLINTGNFQTLKTIREWRKLLPLVPEENRAALLAPPHGLQSLKDILHVPSYVGTCANMLHLMPHQDCARLAEAIDKQGGCISCVLKALLFNNKLVVKAWMQFIKEVPKESRIQLIETIDKNDVPATNKILGRNVVALRKWESLWRLLPTVL
jgi:hypothetical protein